MRSENTKQQQKKTMNVLYAAKTVFLLSAELSMSKRYHVSKTTNFHSLTSPNEGVCGSNQKESSVG